ncbi:MULTISPECIES: type II secretion system minor pseudopilin [Bradyrhizobium]|uniref:General secretion pathway protein GspK n=1 Tax=Bradyrhizobium barranii subsp. barranii TaxID=2823807 RepID=A0A939MEK3_9BRAD|nr:MULTISPECIES: type II secretion system protein GspK [Bradyrhizobium]UEM11284.1 general secretion pathway protein GspK [Bradyrhizobium barranii subsp. barranii]WLB88329.1 type II secretion system protein GspK [Bradyrhizobium japonicum USDA 135]
MLQSKGQSSRKAGPRDGFILVAVLWFLAALAALIVVFSHYLSNSARVLRIDDDALQAEALVAAGVELAAYQLLMAKNEERPRRGGFSIRIGGDVVAVSFLTEAARVDLNAAPKEMIANLFNILGADAEAAQDHADRVVSWRTKPVDKAAARSEEALYAAAGRKYGPRLAPFVHVDELPLVLGPPSWLLDRVMPFVTVFSGSPGIDILAAPAEVVASVPGMTPLILKDFLASRDALSAGPAAIAQVPASARVIAGKSNAWRLRVSLHPADGRRRSSVVVIELGEGKLPYRVLSHEDEGAQTHNARGGA